MASVASLAASLVIAASGAAVDLLAPSGLWLLLLLAPLVALYILKVRRKRRKVASTWLWASAQRDLMARAPWKRLLPQIPLLLEALAIIALALALARPAARGRELSGDHVAVVLDASASMSALATAGPEPKTRMDLARQVAKDLVATLPPGSDVLVLEAGRDARLVAPLDRDRVRVSAAIDRVVARDVEGDLGAAVALGADRLRQLGGTRRLVIVTDGQLARPASLSGLGVPVEVVTVGAPTDNAAIVRVDVRSGSDPATRREQVQGFLVVANFGAAPRELYVTMRQENASDVLASRRVLVAPGERVPVVLTFQPSAGDYRKGLLFEISPRDAMPSDDVAYARVPAGDKLPVFLATTKGDSPWLERALASDPMVALRTGSVEALSAPGAIEPDAFVVIDGACPPSPPGGDLLIVDPPPGPCFGTVVGATVERPLLTSWDTADARMRFLTLDGVHLSRAKALRPEAVSQELVRIQEGVVATDISTPGRAGTLLGFDVGDSDWPLKASFVLFVRNLLEQARTHRAHGLGGPARTGQPLRATLPPGAGDVSATGPDGEPIEVSLRDGLAVVADTPRAGLYRVSWKGAQAGTLVVPVNLTSPAESNLNAPRLEAGAAEDVSIIAAGAQPDGHVEYGWIFALLALGLLVSDVVYVTRRPRVPAALASGAALRPRAPERRAS